MGWRLIRWVGDPAPWADPVIVNRLTRGLIPMQWVEQIREFDVHQRISAIPGRSEYVIGPDHGFSQTYTFAPRQFAAWLTDEDARLLLSNEWDRWQFIDVTDAPSTYERPPMTWNDWGRLLSSFAKLGRRRWRKGTRNQ